MWFVPKVSVLIFLCTKWQRSTSMYIGTLVVTLAACPYVSTGLVEPVMCYCCLCMVVFSNLVTFAMQENIEQILCETQQICHRDICFFNRSLWRCHCIENYGFFKWHKAFKEGRENVEDDPRSGRPVSSTNDQNVEVVQAVMAKDRRLSVRMIAEETGLNKNAVHRILTEHLHMRKICAKLVPKNLSVEQKANRLEICQDLLGRLEIEPNFLHKVITR